MQQQFPSHTTVWDFTQSLSCAGIGWCCSGPSSDYEHDVLVIDIGSTGFGWDERFLTVSV